jgi:hypothetical protein
MSELIEDKKQGIKKELTEKDIEQIALSYVDKCTNGKTGFISNSKLYQKTMLKCGDTPLTIWYVVNKVCNNLTK